MLPLRGELQAQSPTSAWSAARAFEQLRARGRDYLHLVKARLSLMVLLSGVVGYWLAAETVDPAHFLWFTLGTFLVVGGANALNQVFERGADACMERTAGRPLPAGRLPLIEASVAAGLMAAVGVLVLLVKNGWLPGVLAAAALLVYLLLYTPLKPRTPWSTLPGAVAGAIPPLMGWSAARGGIAPLACCLFAILFFWQLPHTWAIAATYREDYERVGYRAFARRKFQALLASSALVLASLMPAWLGLAGRGYLVGASLLGLLLLAASIRFGVGRDRKRAVQLMAATLFYLPLLLALFALDGKVS